MLCFVNGFSTLNESINSQRHIKHVNLFCKAEYQNYFRDENKHRAIYY